MSGRRLSLSLHTAARSNPIEAHTGMKMKLLTSPGAKSNLVHDEYADPHAHTKLRYEYPQSLRRFHVDLKTDNVGIKNRTITSFHFSFHQINPSC
jgi:hypothetical protein